MKFLTIQDRVDSSDSDLNTFITIGRLIEYGTFTGIYLILRSPLKFKSEYISPIDFESKYGVCRNSYLFWIRKHADSKIHPLYHKVTIPVKK